MMADQKPIAAFKQTPRSTTQLVADHGGPTCVDRNSIAVLPVAHRNRRLEGRSGVAQVYYIVVNCSCY